MNQLHRTFILPFVLMLGLSACGNDTEQLDPDTPDGAPSYEQLNPPVPPSESSSMAPATPGSQQEATELPLPGQNSDHSVPEDAPASQKDDAVTLP
jgi:hypothetical protein